jgi:hypothetical protein
LKNLELESLKFNIKIVIAKNEVKRLKMFFEAIDGSQSSKLIQETNNNS